MRRYKAPDDITSFFVGGNFFRVEDGFLSVPDGIDIDVIARGLGFLEVVAAASAEEPEEVGE